MIEPEDRQDILLPEGDPALTSIHGSYTLPRTPGHGEVDDVIVDNFIKTLAEVAMAIATRESRG